MPEIKRPFGRNCAFVDFALDAVAYGAHRRNLNEAQIASLANFNQILHAVDVDDFNFVARRKMFDESRAVNDCRHVGKGFDLFERVGARDIAFQNENPLAEKFRVTLIEIIEQLRLESSFGGQIFFPAQEAVNFAGVILNEFVQDVNSEIARRARQNDIAKRLSFSVAEVVQSIRVENRRKFRVIVVGNFFVDGRNCFGFLERGKFAGRAIDEHVGEIDFVAEFLRHDDDPGHEQRRSAQVEERFVRANVLNLQYRAENFAEVAFDFVFGLRG